MLSRFGKWLGELCWGVVWGCYKGFIRGEWVFYLFAECCVRIEVGGGMSVGALWGLCAVFVVSVGNNRQPAVLYFQFVHRLPQTIKLLV